MLRRKRLRIDQRKLDRARRLLGTRTEQETVDRALDLVLATESPARRRIAAIRAAARHHFPAPDIALMLAEIEGGYLRRE